MNLTSPHILGYLMDVIINNYILTTLNKLNLKYQAIIIMAEAHHAFILWNHFHFLTHLTFSVHYSEYHIYLFKCPKRRCPLSNSLLQCIMGHEIAFPDTCIWPPLRNELFVPELIVPALSPASLDINS